jgi:hypothetical protein
MYFPMISGIVKYYDMNRATLIEQIEEARKTLEKLLTLLQSAPVARPICFSPLSGPEGLPTDVRNSWKVRQANRAVRHLDIPDRREHGL